MTAAPAPSHVAVLLVYVNHKRGTKNEESHSVLHGLWRDHNLKRSFVETNCALRYPKGDVRS